VKSTHWNGFLVIIFFLLAIGIYFLGTQYKESQREASLQSLYGKIAQRLTSEVQILIEEKRNATLTIAMALAEDVSVKKAVQNREDIHDKLALFSKKLKESTDFKNVWIQLVDERGVSISRSWTQMRGDALKSFRPDVSKMLLSPEIRTTISVGKYDLSFKGMVPFFDEQRNLLGFVEVITHFNSVIKKLQDEDVEALVLVDKSYKEQIKYPFTNKFIGDYYLANKNANEIIVTYVEGLGVEHFVSYKENYSITDDGVYLRINSTLFEKDSTPMAYILLFQKIKDIDTSSISNKGMFIDLLVVFALTVVAFVLSLFMRKEDVQVAKEKGTLKTVLFFAAFFIFIITLYYLFLNSYKNHEEKHYLEAYNQSMAKDYSLISRHFETVAETMFQTILNTPKVHKLVQMAYGDDKDRAREELYRLLVQKYRYYTDYDVRQFHFHLRNNESFLRFHRPNKYGDDLSNIRETVKWVNENYKKIKGFEEGRIYNGLRYVFPLSVAINGDNSEHIGSVEVSFDLHAIANEFVLAHDAKVALLVAKSTVNKKLFDDEKTHYIESEFDDFYYDGVIKKKFQKLFKDISVEKLSVQKRNCINNKIAQGTLFTVVSTDNSTLFSFIPLQNPVTKEIAGALIVQRACHTFEENRELFVLIFFGGGVLILLTLIFVYREFSLKLDFRNLSLQTREILDVQKSMILITDGSEMSDVNRKLLDFFGYESFEAFKNKYGCICQAFLEDENYFHLQKVPEGISWMEYLDQIPHKERIVLLEDAYGSKHSFALTFSKYNLSHYIFTFTDISETVSEQLSLEHKVIHDKLTGAYNREFFELKKEEIVSVAQESGRFVGVIFFDIDYFKNVNDTYGHAVGDSVLVELIEQISLSIRSNDYLVRWGGEEFIILLSTNSADELLTVAENLRSKIAKHTFEHVMHITCSFGVSLMREEESLLETVRRADEALYISKENGRDRVSKL